MKGDYTRDTFRPERQYTQVRQQQGRVQLDADWNEAFDIVTSRGRATNADVIGPCGAPKNAAGYGISVVGGNLRIGAGRYYAHGILCANPAPVAFTEQPHYPGGALPETGRRFLAYLDVWERHITALEDPAIREVALGGPDTATRLQLIAQVKLAPVPDDATCGDFGVDWRPADAAGAGSLAARAQPAPQIEQPCLIPPGAGFRRLENQLYRVEIHTPGALDVATFKWSRENGSVVTAWTGQDGDVLTIADAGRDDNLGFHTGDWVELSDDGRTLRGEPGILVQLLDVQGLELTIDPATIADPDDPAANSVNFSAFGPGPTIRRWDSAGALLVEVAADNDGFLALEEGVEARFDPAGGNFRTGDYWLIPARTNTGGVLWPIDEGTGEPLPQLPHGVAHHYCPLALVDRDANGWQVVADCRCFFPPLCDIHAEDVKYDNRNCRPELANAETVQDALDILCRTNGGRCTFHVTPGSDLQAVFDAIPSRGDAQICFAVGDYVLDDTVTVEGKGHLQLSGSGPGTRLMIERRECALLFRTCESVTVENLAAESRMAELVRGNSLFGVLTFAECGQVTVDQVRVQCAHGFERAASCVRVENAPDDAIRDDVRIRHSTFLVGHLQTGILLTDVWRAQVEDNVIRAASRSGRVDLGDLVANRRARAALRRLLIANPQRTRAGRPAGGEEVVVRVGDQTLRFTTAPQLASPNLWQRLVEAEARPDEAPEATLLRVADRMLTDARVAETFPRLREWLRTAERDHMPVAGQGIVAGGRRATDLRIVDNTLQEVLQGIHVGVSHREAERGAPDIAVTALIRGNTIGVSLPSGATRERHGIFVGNCSSLVVEDNYLTLQRFATTERLRIEGVRIFGYLGKRAILRQNHLQDFSVGIRMNPLNPSKNPPTPLWLVADNVASVQVTNDNAPVTPAEQQARVRQSQNFA